MNNTGLYIHIPFCKEKCLYCDFYSLKADTELYKIYCNALIKEIKKWSEKLKGKTIDTVYFGGGTPSVIGYELINQILNEARTNFNINKDAEITIEVNPDSANEIFLREIFKNGFNRISFGVQSFIDSELMAIGRIHNANTAIVAINTAKKVGFNNISIDLMFNLPNQSINDFEKNIKKAIELEPKHISAYALKLEKGTVLYKNKNSLNLADEDTEFLMYNILVEKLKNAGYFQYEISNFSKPNFESKHNLKYWSGQDYLGLGVSAHSLIDNKRFFNKRDINGYIEGKNIKKTEAILTKEEKLKEYILLGLRKSNGISFKELSQYSNEEFVKKIKKKAEYFCNLGYLILKEDGFYFNTKGFWVSNTIIYELIALI